MSNIDQIIDRFSKMPYHKEGNKPYGAPVVYLSEIDYLIDNLREQKNEIEDTKLSEILTPELIKELSRRDREESKNEEKRFEYFSESCVYRSKNPGISNNIFGCRSPADDQRFCCSMIACELFSRGYHDKNRY